MIDKESVVSVALFGPKLHYDFCKPHINNFPGSAHFVIYLSIQNLVEYSDFFI